MPKMSHKPSLKLSVFDASQQLSLLFDLVEKGTENSDRLRAKLHWTNAALYSLVVVVASSFAACGVEIVSVSQTGWVSSASFVGLAIAGIATFVLREILSYRYRTSLAFRTQVLVNSELLDVISHLIESAEYKELGAIQQLTWESRLQLLRFPKEDV